MSTFEKLAQEEYNRAALLQANRAARTVVKQVGPDGIIPAVFEPRWANQARRSPTVFSKPNRPGS